MIETGAFGITFEKPDIRPSAASGSLDHRSPVSRPESVCPQLIVVHPAVLSFMHGSGTMEGILARLGLIVAILVTFALAALLLVTQLDTWTCNAPDGVWLEGPDHCVELP